LAESDLLEIDTDHHSNGIKAMMFAIISFL